MPLVSRVVDGDEFPESQDHDPRNYREYEKIEYESHTEDPNGSFAKHMAQQQEEILVAYDWDRDEEKKYRR